MLKNYSDSGCTEIIGDLEFALGERERADAGQFQVLSLTDSISKLPCANI